MARDGANTISVDELIKAYSLGYFPMARARDDTEIVWILPDERGFIDLNTPRAPRRLRRVVKSERFTVTVNKAFPAVIEACAAAATNRPETWINDAIIEVYTELHYIGLAHSVECWRDERLVGGLYGVALGAAFCGESMFSRETDASKVAMAHLIAMLKLSDFDFIDAQFYNEHLVQFGLIGMSNDDYQRRLERAIEKEAAFPADDQPSIDCVLQSITQTS